VKVILKEAYDFLVDSSEQYRLIVVDLHGNTQSDWERLAPVLIKNLQAGGALFLGNLNLSEVADWKLETGVRWFLDQLPKNWKCEYFTASLPGFAIAWKPT
jgi:predicted oxidoreductase